MLVQHLEAGESAAVGVKGSEADVRSAHVDSRYPSRGKGARPRAARPPGSAPWTVGLPLPRGADLEIRGLSLPRFERGTGLRGVACMFPTLPATCGLALSGKLLHANPSEWSFSCSSESNGDFWSVGGRLIGS